MRVLSVEGGELAEQVLLLFAELARRDDDDADMLVADAVAAQMRNSFAFEAEEGTGLGACRDLELHLLGQRWDLNLVTQCRLSERQGNLAHNIVVLALEEIMILHTDHNVQISGRAAACAAFAFTGHAQLCAVIDTGRDTHMNLALSLHLALACAGGAFLFDDFACAAAIRAGTAVTHLSKRCILHEFLLSAAVADGTGLRLRTRLGSGAEAGIAGLRAWNGNIGLFAEHRFLELNGHRILQVAAALWGIRITPSTAAAEEHIEDITKTAEISATAAKAAAHSLIRSICPY